ncbi:MAG: hypothetical protein AAFW70_19935 [Cyanobacteria bacterium J06635_10]
MHTSKLIGLIVGTSLAFSGFLADSASAQSNNSNTSGSNLSNITGSNLSNITGTNVFDGAPIFTQFGGLNPQTLDQASQLSDQLTDALVNCNNCGCNSTPSPCNVRGFLLGQGSHQHRTETTKPRTFALGEKDPNQSCPSPSPTQPSGKCEELTTVLNESKAFLDQVNQQVEATKTSIIRRTW